MSKIEQILEKATMLREQGRVTASVGEACTVPLPVQDYSAFDVESKVKVTNPYLVTLVTPNSPVTEEYKKLKSIVVKLTRAEQFLNTLMITSTHSGEGKSITALNLAITLAQEYDHTVLLVDADLRRPSADEYLGIETGPGLSDCLVNGTDPADALIKTGIGKLSFLPAGGRVSNPVELLSSARMKEFVKELKHRYTDRYVIIDTPPVLHFAEAHSIASAVDGIIFVVREGHVPIQHLKESLNMLKDYNVLGVVYNDVEVTRYNSYYQYFNYNYYSNRGGA